MNPRPAPVRVHTDPLPKSFEKENTQTIARGNSLSAQSPIPRLSNSSGSPRVEVTDGGIRKLPSIGDFVAVASCSRSSSSRARTNLSINAYSSHESYAPSIDFEEDGMLTPSYLLRNRSKSTMSREQFDSFFSENVDSGSISRSGGMPPRPVAVSSAKTDTTASHFTLEQAKFNPARIELDEKEVYDRVVEHTCEAALNDFSLSHSLGGNDSRSDFDAKTPHAVSSSVKALSPSADSKLFPISRSMQADSMQADSMPKSSSERFDLKESSKGHGEPILRRSHSQT